MKAFSILIMIGRPASGKSEIIDYLSRLEPQERLNRYHIGEMDVIDDFPMLWTWFEEDRILELKLGKPRLHSDPQGYFLYDHLWHVLAERLDLEYHRRKREVPGYHERFTTIIEFARGSEHGGYMQAFEHLSDDVWRQAGIVYVKVSFDESLRKNRRRYNPERPYSILEHSLPDEKLARLYHKDDWDAVSAGDPQFVTVREIRVPYAVFENEDDVTTSQLDELAVRLEEVLGRLWALRGD